MCFCITKSEYCIIMDRSIVSFHTKVSLLEKSSFELECLHHTHYIIFQLLTIQMFFSQFQRHVGSLQHKMHISYIKILCTYLGTLVQASWYCTSWLAVTPGNAEIHTIQLIMSHSCQGSEQCTIPGLRMYMNLQ